MFGPMGGMNQGLTPLGQTVSGAINAGQLSTGEEASESRIWLRDDETTFPFKYSLAISTSMHVLTPIVVPLLWAMVLFLLAALFNIRINLADLFPPPKPKTRPPIEFVLVPERGDQMPEDAKFLGEFNQEAGGEPEENKEPAPFEDAASAGAQSQDTPESAAKQSPAPSPRPTPQVNPQQQQQAAKPQPKPTPQKQPKPPAPTPAKVAIAVPAPKPVDVAPTPKPTPPGAQNTNPMPPMKATTGPSSPASQASQKLASLSKNGLAENVQRKGQAEQGNKKRPGVSVRKVDFGPYMADVKRRIARNWRPPRGDRDKRVEVVFQIFRDGTLGTIQVKTSSGEKVADSAAMNAVKLSAPFKPLPPSHRGDSVPVLFTFDYNVLGGTY